MVLFTVFRPPNNRCVTSPGAPFSGNDIPASPITPSVEDFKNRIITSPLLLLFCPKRRRRGKKLKVDFLENLSSDFRKISQQRAPYGDLPKDITSDPPPKLGAGPGGPKFGGYPSKISHFRFSGVEIFTTVSSEIWRLHKLRV